MTGSGTLHCRRLAHGFRDRTERPLALPGTELVRYEPDHLCGSAFRFSRLKENRGTDFVHTKYMSMGVSMSSGVMRCVRLGILAARRRCGDVFSAHRGYLTRNNGTLVGTPKAGYNNGLRQFSDRRNCRGQACLSSSINANRAARRLNTWFERARLRNHRFAHNARANACGAS